MSCTVAQKKEAAMIAGFGEYLEQVIPLIIMLLDRTDLMHARHARIANLRLANQASKRLQ